MPCPSQGGEESGGKLAPPIKKERGQWGKKTLRSNGIEKKGKTAFNVNRKEASRHGFHFTETKGDSPKEIKRDEFSKEMWGNRAGQPNRRTRVSIAPLHSEQLQKGKPKC